MTYQLTLLALFLLVIGLPMIAVGILMVFHRPFYNWLDITFFKDDSKLMNEKDSYQYKRFGRGVYWIIVGLIFTLASCFWLSFIK